MKGVIFLKLCFWPHCLFLCFVLVHFAWGETCTAIDQCSCKLTNGKIITLWDIDKRYQMGSIPPGFTYHYRPCTGLSEPNSDCNGALGCQVSNDKKVDIADKPKYIDATKDGGSGLYMFSYTGSFDQQLGRKIKLKVLLQCNMDKDASFTDMLGCEAGDCILTLASKCACPGTCSLPQDKSVTQHNDTLSTGSVLCIILLVLIVVYFVGGIVINKYAMHKEGSDVIPQKSLWFDLPSLVKDGCIFSYRKIRSGKGDYEQI